jgi:hypothetical protein
MDKILELSLQLLQTTQAMHDSIEAGELLPLEELQQQRTELVTELDQESQQPYPRDVLAGCRDLIEQARALENSIADLLEQKRDELGEEYGKLKRSQQASKAYDRFS